MNAAYTMLEELALNEYDIEQTKQFLIERNVQRLLDFHLGLYELEEGEVLEHWNLDELERTAKDILMARYMRDLCQKQEEEPFEIVISDGSDNDDLNNDNDNDNNYNLEDDLWRLEFEDGFR